MLFQCSQKDVQCPKSEYVYLSVAFVLVSVISISLIS